MNDKILVYGNYMYSKPGYGGQITKTRNVFALLRKRYGEENVIAFNMEHWKRYPISTLINLKKKIKNVRHLVILPGDNNLKLLLIVLKKCVLKKQLNVYYMVVGGWLYDYLKNKKKKTYVASKFSGIYVETHALQHNLESLGLKNVYYSPVFSLRSMRNESDINNDIASLKKKECFRLCTFSRVLKEKGVADAAEAVAILNKAGKKYQLDIFGAIDESYKSEFKSILDKHGDFVRYCGFIDDDKVIDTLSQYHFLIFPTYYYGEGFPATLLEANMAGLPILASNWKYNNEIVIDNYNGYLFEPRNITDISKCISKAFDNADTLYGMRFAALKNAEKYTPEKALEPLFDTL